METAFAFGENWADFSQLLDESRVTEAEAAITRIVGDVRGRTFLDVGCGSGVHAVAAARLGAIVTAIDIDPGSVETSRQVAQRFAPQITVEHGSAFDVSQHYDVIYSWGVLHHTGDMWQAIDHVARYADTLALALYTRSPLCPLWKIEKRLYSKYHWLQPAIRSAYKAVYLSGLVATGRNPVSYIRGYASNRGMDWHHDVHDWLGGYPYESATPDEVRQFLADRGFTSEREFRRPAPVAGLFGTGCSEYLFRKA